MISALALSLVVAGQTQTARPAAIPAARIVPKTDAKVGAPVEVDLTLDPKALNIAGDRNLHLPFFPNGIELVDEKPIGIVKEPTYRSKPKYGAFRVGNGPRSVIYFAVDEPETGAGRIYIDANGNGDLTDDGSPEWDETSDNHGVTSYQTNAVVRASWGDAIRESATSNYGLLIYKQKGSSHVGYTRTTGRTGTITIGGKAHKVLLAENQSDAIYTIARSGDATRKPVWLILDPAGKDQQLADLSQPFQLDGKWYEGFPTLSGDKITIRPSAAAGAKPVMRDSGPKVALLKEGVAAPLNSFW